MAETKRIKKAINWLISQGKYNSQSEIGEILGITNRSYLSQLVNSEAPKVEFVNKFIELAPEINRDWLITGEGEMLNNIPANAAFIGTARSAISEHTIPVRFFEVAPSATFREFMAADVAPSRLDIIPALHEAIDDSYCVFQVHGESMAPQIQNRACVLCQEILNSKWHSLTHCVVVIAYADKFVIKRIIKNHLQTENFLILASDNPDFPQRECVQLADIRCIFQAKRIISSPIS